VRPWHFPVGRFDRRSDRPPLSPTANVADRPVSPTAPPVGVPCRSNLPAGRTSLPVGAPCRLELPVALAPRRPTVNAIAPACFRTCLSTFGLIPQQTKLSPNRPRLPATCLQSRAVTNPPSSRQSHFGNSSPCHRPRRRHSQPVQRTPFARSRSVYCGQSGTHRSLAPRTFSAAHHPNVG
jgi:hypothetical protein